MASSLPIRATLLLTLVTNLPACGNEQEIEDLGDVSGGDRADVTSLELPFDLDSGEYTRTFRLTSDTPLRIVAVAVQGPPDTDLLLTAADGSTNPEDRGIEPSVEVAPGEIQFFLRNMNVDFPTRGSLFVEPTTSSTNKVRLEIAGYALGDLSDNESRARENWQRACDTWIAKQKELIGADRVEIADCGTAKDQDSHAFRFLFASEPKLTVVVEVPRGTQELVPNKMMAVGSINSSDVTQATRSWEQNCQERSASAKARFGDRFIAATCPRPKDIDSHAFNTLLQSPVLVYLAPTEKSDEPGAQTIEIKGAIMGTEGNSLEGASKLSWGDQCELWLHSQKEQSGLAIESFDCGTPKDEDSHAFVERLRSEPSIVFAPVNQEVLTKTEEVQGENGSDDESAFRSWEAACDARIASYSEYGERLLAAVCEPPRDIDSHAFKATYRSTLKVFIEGL